MKLLCMAVSFYSSMIRKEVERGDTIRNRAKQKECRKCKDQLGQHQTSSFSVMYRVEVNVDHLDVSKLRCIIK